jgi:hypothetical protein
MRLERRRSVLPWRAMPDTHLPDLDRHDEGAATTVLTPPARPRRRSVVKIGLEVLLIALGVFLGLAGDQWRETSHQRELAAASLRRFRAELVANRDAVAGVRDKHTVGFEGIQAYFAADDRTRRTMAFPSSTDPAFLRYAAWDLAIATQALGDIDQDLAQDLAGVYAVQRQLDNATRTITDVMYTLAGESNRSPFLASLSLYFDDCNLIEPRLLTIYDDVLKKLDAAIGHISP